MNFFKEYIKGNRHGKEANKLEKASLEDAFLYEAIEGYDSVKGDHDKVIDRLEKKILNYHKRRDKQILLIRITAIAAALLIIIFAGFYFFKTNSTNAVSEKHLISKAAPIPPKQINPKPEQKQPNKEQTLVRSTIAFPPPVISEDKSESSVSQDRIIASQAAVSTVNTNANISSAMVEKSSVANNEIPISSEAKKKTARKTTFNKIQFEQYFYQHATKNICNDNLNTVKVIFDIDTNHRPTNINFQEFTCDAAKAEVLKWLKASPDWDETAQQIKLELSW